MSHSSLYDDFIFVDWPDQEPDVDNVQYALCCVYHLKATRHHLDWTRDQWETDHDNFQRWSARPSWSVP